GGEHFTGQTGPLSPGAMVVLVQPRAGILQGRVIPPQGTPENSITLTLARDDDGAERPRRNRNPSTPIRRRNGYFWLGNLQPGVYTATVTMRGLQSPLATFRALRIDPGTNEDARLSPLDLSLALYHYRLRALSQNGQPLAAVDGPILWRQQPAGQDAPQFTAFRWQEGKADFFLPVAFADFVLVGQGYAATTVALAAGDRDVVLQPISPFPIELPGVRSLCGPTRSIRVSAVSTTATGLPEGIGGQDQQKGEGFSFSRWHLGKSGGGWLDSADRTGLVVSRSGPHELTLRIYEGADRQGRQAAIPLGTHELTVDGSALRPLSLAVDFAQLQAALQSLQPRPQQDGGAAPNGPRNATRRR
ncbi:MAG: carboxypeptidase-like regulatory domain-containing protein, partial [Planctomycetota bacterium]